MKPLCLSLILLCCGCAAAPAAAPTPPPTPPGPYAAGKPLPFTDAPLPVPAGGFELRMQRSGCYGICPSYQVGIHADGAVDYEGYSHVVSAGAQHGQADAKALAALRTRLEDSGSGALWGRYTRGSPACGNWATDMPGVRIDAYVDGRWQRIEHDWGCFGAPAGLKALEQAIDDVAQSQLWVSGRSTY